MAVSSYARHSTWMTVHPEAACRAGQLHAVRHVLVSASRRWTSRAPRKRAGARGRQVLRAPPRACTARRPRARRRPAAWAPHKAEGRARPSCAGSRWRSCPRMRPRWRPPGARCRLSVRRRERRNFQGLHEVALAQSAPAVFQAAGRRASARAGAGPLSCVAGALFMGKEPAGVSGSCGWQSPGAH